MNWEHNRQELFDTGVAVFNLDYDVVETIKKYNIKIQRKIDYEKVNLNLEMSLKYISKNRPKNLLSTFNGIKDKVVEINKFSTDFANKSIKYTMRSPGGQILLYNKKEFESMEQLKFNFRGSYTLLRTLKEFLVENYNDRITQVWYYIDTTPLPKMDTMSPYNVILWKKLKDIFLKLYEDKVIEEKVDKTYFGARSNENAQIQSYDKGCFIYKHRDGSPMDSGQCQMLLYLNDDWKLGMGGELSCINSKGKERIIEPKIGTCVVIDYTKNSSHEVKVVKDKNFLRNVIRCDWIINSTRDKQYKDELGGTG